MSDGPEIEAMAKDVAKYVLRQLSIFGGEARGSELGEIFRFARYTASAAGQRNVLKLAQSERGIPIAPEALDSDPWAWNCANGTVDLQTAQLRPHRREDLITKLCPVAYDPDATCPTWERFVYEIMDRDRDMVAYKQRTVGMSMAGVQRDHVLHLEHGDGANGKSTDLNAVLDTFGTDYAMQAPPDLLMVKQGTEHPTAQADLFGKRFVACIESDDNRRLAESLLKSLTGGDKMRARRMREDFWEFAPTHHIWLATNHRPTIRGTDLGVWRRIRLIPFNVSIPPDRQDKELPEKLHAERAGILRWCVEGCLAWQKCGLSEPEKVLAATKDYRDEQDVFAGFLDECVETGPYRERASVLYGGYVTWAKSAGEYIQTQTKFGTALDERGFQRRKSSGVKWYDGVRLRAEYLPPNDREMWGQ